MLSFRKTPKWLLHYPLNFCHCSYHCSTNIEDAYSSRSGSDSKSLKTWENCTQYMSAAICHLLIGTSILRLDWALFTLCCCLHLCDRIALMCFPSFILPKKRFEMLYIFPSKLTSACRNILYISGRITGATCPICVSVTSCVNSEITEKNETLSDLFIHELTRL